MPGPTFLDFVQLGCRHIFTGPDHLVFLFGVLLACARGRELVAVISSFTVGHSLTLAAATLGWFQPPARVTEPLIALTIVAVGVENLWRRDPERKYRWLLTLGFGLVHGFGFAGVLRDLGVGRNGTSVALPLFGFNVGVELGQLLFVALLLPGFWLLRKNPVFLRRIAPALSGLVVLAGLYWFIERLIAM